jgi:hypothetical protein
MDGARWASALAAIRRKKAHGVSLVSCIGARGVGRNGKLDLAGSHRQRRAGWRWWPRSDA